MKILLKMNAQSNMKIFAEISEKKSKIFSSSCKVLSNGKGQDFNHLFFAGVKKHLREGATPSTKTSAKPSKSVKLFMKTNASRSQKNSANLSKYIMRKLDLLYSK